MSLVRFQILSDLFTGTLRKSSLTTLKWRPITRTTPTTVSTLSTKPAWFIKSSQRFFQKLEDRKRWELEKLNRTKPGKNYSHSFGVPEHHMTPITSSIAQPKPKPGRPLREPKAHRATDTDCKSI
jgi:hypothetical protein